MGLGVFPHSIAFAGPSFSVAVQQMLGCFTLHDHQLDGRYGSPDRRFGFGVPQPERCFVDAVPLE